MEDEADLRLGETDNGERKKKDAYSFSSLAERKFGHPFFRQFA